MAWQQADSVETKCYPSEKKTGLRIAGWVLIAVGLITVLLFVPYWALAAIIGIGLIALGIMLIQK